MATPEQLNLLALCALRDGSDGVDWPLIAREALRLRSVEPLLAGNIGEHSAAAEKSLLVLRRLLERLPQARDRATDMVAEADAVGARLITVLDAEYPSTLKLIPQLPPFLFVAGDELDDAALRSVAVVGTRNATEHGLAQAARLARELTASGVTVISGLAVGIDTAAHRATLDAGGRTIAVVGTGITRTYPPQNEALAGEIAEHGTVVSPFWPTATPAKWTFPRRNVVMSGLAQGTAVIEASTTSGAKMQARIAIEHGKRLFLLRSLVTDQPWARGYLERGAVEVDDVENVLAHLAAPERIRHLTEQRERQLTLDLV
jgi:DNA processing protein